MDLRNELECIAPVLNNLQYDANAETHYDLMAGGLFWSDEVPVPRLDSELAFRYLLRFRTSVICGESLEPIRPYWDYAKDCFPNWPGFRPERIESTPTLTKLHIDLREKAEAIMES